MECGGLPPLWLRSGVASAGSFSVQPTSTARRPVGWTPESPSANGCTIPISGFVAHSFRLRTLPHQRIASTATRSRRGIFRRAGAGPPRPDGAKVCSQGREPLECGWLGPSSPSGAIAPPSVAPAGLVLLRPGRSARSPVTRGSRLWLQADAPAGLRSGHSTDQTWSLMQFVVTVAYRLGCALTRALACGGRSPPYRCSILPAGTARRRSPVRHSNGRACHRRTRSPVPRSTA